MSNPKFACDSTEYGYKELSLVHHYHNGYVKGFIQLIIEKDHSHYERIILNKGSVSRLIEELQSWLDTGEFVKPKRRFVFVENGKALPNIQEADSPEEILYLGLNICGKQKREIYELKPEDAIK
jgi:hypothetical protein